MRHAQRLVALRAQASNLFRAGRHLLRVCSYRPLMTGRFASWTEVTGARGSPAFSA